MTSVHNIFIRTMRHNIITPCAARIALAVMTALAATLAHAEDKATARRTPAFPTAEGYGKYATGGRGGDVYIVRNLNDSGDGSLRQGLKNDGRPRTIVFAVSGTIELNSKLRVGSNTTIAGQTAPGDGICLKNYALSIGGDNVIVRYIRSRMGDERNSEDDAINSRFHKDIIIDHCSASWSIDETMSVYHCENVTIQWCIIAESLYASKHVKGTHGFGGILGNNHSTYHHNLLAHHTSRNPRFASGCGYNDYRNNVIYNWGYNSCYGGEKYQKGAEDRYNFSVINIVGNYYKPGPATLDGDLAFRIAAPSHRTSPADDFGQWYVAGNHIEGHPAATEDNWTYGVQVRNADIKQSMRMDEPWQAMPINMETPHAAYISVLEKAGCSRPKRDEADMRIINDVRNGTAACEGTAYKRNNAARVKDSSIPLGIIDTQNDVGGWPTLKSTTPPDDSDADGMPDEWETANNLNPHDASDRNIVAHDGYTMLEHYINQMAGDTHAYTDKTASRQ
ncbi:MAG: pectate lyase [Bacteroidales bacterium]|nr:pectate lyase [Bacteroidales bacterium]